MNSPSFFSELKRRNVIRMAGLYLVGAWLLTQVASTVLPMYGAPAWLPRSIVTLLAIGFVPALIFSWIFELTPEGLKRDEEVPIEKSIGPKIARRMDRMIIVVLLFALAYFAFDKFVLTPGKETAQSIPATRGLPEQKSIAVLPFENLSEDKANVYFANGIQEEILTRLTKIANLKVISRTSTQQYQSKPGNLAEIAKQLGVSHILEGSVQRVADEVRVNVQLIHAQTDSHAWADTYDRKLTDIFAVESEIAKSIAESLQAKLTGREQQALAVRPTNNPEAYDAYLRALSADAQGVYSVYLLEKAIGFFEQAVQLDPNFALAWAKMARANIYYYWNGETTPARLDAVKRALDRAQKLQPDSPETLLALGYYQYQVLRDYGAAKATLGAVAKILPGSSEVPSALARIARKEGRWNESIAYLDQALVLDPRNTELLVTAADTYSYMRQFPASRKSCDRVLDITPNELDIIAAKANDYQAEGNLEEAAKLLAKVDALTPSYNVAGIKVTQLILERRTDEAVRLLQTRMAQFHFGAELEKGIYQGILTFTQYVAGDQISAKASAEQARNTLEPLSKTQPDNDFLAVFLSRVYAVLGDKNSALKEAQRAMTISPTAKDAVRGPGMDENLAVIQLIFGENSRVIATLARLLEVPYGGYLYGTPVTPSLLRLDPMWDPLRADPAFQKLCEEKPR